MARALRLQFPGAIYHVTTRGNERRMIYRDDADRERFLEKLEEYVPAHHVRLYAYALMRNHFHLLVETPRANLVPFMHQLNGSYCVYFNCRHRRSGHLFGGRYKAKLVEGDEYLLKLTRYIHLNPVAIRSMKARPMGERIKLLGEYRWSSYRAYAGLCRAQAWVDYAPLAELVSRGRKREELIYRAFVEKGLAETDEELREALERSSKAIGLESFCRWAEGLYRDLSQQQGQPLDVALRRMEHAVPVEEVLEVVSADFGIEREELQKKRWISDARMLAMKLLKEEAGLTQRQVAAELGLRDGSGISRRLVDVSKQLGIDPRLRRRYQRLREQLYQGLTPSASNH